MPKDLRHFLAKMEAEMPEDIAVIRKVIDPKYEITAVQQHLENDNRFPLVFFEQVKNLKGQISDFRLVSNLFASRQKVALALDLPKDQWRMEPAFEFANRAANPIKPVIVDHKDAPVHQVVKTGDQVDLYDLPVVTHHTMDGLPYMVDAVVAADPETGVHNSSHHRQLIKGKNLAGIWMSPRHLWNYVQRAHAMGKPLPFCHVHGAHPAFYLGSEALVPMEWDEYDVIGGILGEPLRLVPSVTFGDRLMVPADAEVVIEGEILPERDAEGPFGEFTGYYGPQRWGPLCRITAITHRRDPIWVNILVGHPDTSILGGIPKEAGTYNAVKAALPGVQKVHFPISGSCRFAAYISIKQRVDGEALTAAMAALPHHDELKLVIVVDDDIDPFNEREVMWAVATRVQAGTDVNIIRNARGGSLDPSAVRHAVGDKMIIDATRPVDRAYSERISVPKDVMQRIDIRALIESGPIKVGA